MLTLVEAISLAGDRNKQNDDACGCLSARAWVIDGATDLHEAPLTRWASDASWIAHDANSQFYGHEGLDLREVVRSASSSARSAFANLVQGRALEGWQSPVASLLMVEENDKGLSGLDLGDCRCFALDADGVAHAIGGPQSGVVDETQRARDAAARAGGTPLLRHGETLDMLRAVRARANKADGYWVFGLAPDCADHARLWTLALKRPAHLLLATDGFAALVDRYGAYDGAALVQAALAKGLHELGRELRAIEAGDAAGALHPRFKASDDATALLLRLT